MQELIAAIQKYQAKNKLSDNRFARALNIDPSLWSKIKNSRQAPGGQFLRAIARTYPKLRKAVYRYMEAPEKEAAAVA